MAPAPSSKVGEHLGCMHCLQNEIKCSKVNIIGVTIIAALATITMIGAILLAVSQLGYLPAFNAVATAIPAAVIYGGIAVASAVLILDVALIALMIRNKRQQTLPENPKQSVVESAPEETGQSTLKEEVKNPPSNPDNPNMDTTKSSQPSAKISSNFKLGPFNLVLVRHGSMGSDLEELTIINRLSALKSENKIKHLRVNEHFFLQDVETKSYKCLKMSLVFQRDAAGQLFCHCFQKPEEVTTFVNAMQGSVNTLKRGLMERALITAIGKGMAEHENKISAKYYLIQPYSADCSQLLTYTSTLQGQIIAKSQPVQNTQLAALKEQHDKAGSKEITLTDWEKIPIGKDEKTYLVDCECPIGFWPDIDHWIEKGNLSEGEYVVTTHDKYTCLIARKFGAEKVSYAIVKSTSPDFENTIKYVRDNFTKREPLPWPK